MSQDNHLASHIAVAARDAAKVKPAMRLVMFADQLIGRLQNDGYPALAAKIEPLLERAPALDTAPDALAVQVGGGHYKGMAIQPVEYIHANSIGFCEGCAIKYLSRWQDKGGIEDLRKAAHFIELLIEMETTNAKGS